MDAPGEFRKNIDDLEAIESGQYDNIFRMFIKDKKYYYNILKRVNIDLTTANPEVFEQTKIRFETPWTTISYRAYGTTSLWWLIYLSNPGAVKNPLELIPGGTPLKVIKPAYLRNILDEIEQELTPNV